MTISAHIRALAVPCRGTACRARLPLSPFVAEPSCPPRITGHESLFPFDFLSGRRNPMRYEIVTPGFLNETGEAGAIERLRTLHVPLVFIMNRRSQDFGQLAFGVDYDRRLMSWIERNYSLCGAFGSDPDPNLQMGSPVFFIRGYCLHPSASLEHAPAHALDSRSGAVPPSGLLPRAPE